MSIPAVGRAVRVGQSSLLLVEPVPLPPSRLSLHLWWVRLHPTPRSHLQWRLPSSATSSFFWHAPRASTRALEPAAGSAALPPPRWRRLARALCVILCGMCWHRAMITRGTSAPNARDLGPGTTIAFAGHLSACGPCVCPRAPAAPSAAIPRHAGRPGCTWLDGDTAPPLSWVSFSVPVAQSIAQALLQLLGCVSSLLGDGGCPFRKNSQHTLGRRCISTRAGARRAE
jgi:hypothetical protein